MKKLLILLCFSASMAFAQSPLPWVNASTPAAKAADPAPVPDPNEGVHFVTDSAFYQLADGKQATVFTARLPITTRFSGVFSQWFIPIAKGNISVGGIEYRRNLLDLLRQKSANLELSKFEIFGRGQAGSEIDSITNARHFAYSVEGGLEFPVGTVGGGVVKTGVRLGFVGVPGAHEHFQLGSQAMISPQVSISF